MSAGDILSMVPLWPALIRIFSWDKMISSIVKITTTSHSARRMCRFRLVAIDTTDSARIEDPRSTLQGIFNCKECGLF
jgi:hypothetical protein